MDDGDVSLGVIITKSIFISFFILIAIVGNGSVLYAIQKYPKLKTVPNYFVFNLAIADLLFSLTGMPMILITTIGKGWILGGVMCDIGGLLNSVFCSTSIWTLVMISVHRYFAVSKAAQLKRMYNKKRTCLIIACVWLFAFSISMPPLFGWSRFISGSNFCTVDGRDDMIYSIFLLLTDYFFPFLFLTVLYLRIFLLLRSHEKVMKKSRGKRSTCDVGSEVITSDENDMKSSNECSSPKSLNCRIESKFLGDFLNNKNNNSNVFGNIETKLTSPVTKVHVDREKSFVKLKCNGTSKRHISFSSESEHEINKTTGNTIKRKKAGSIKKFFKEVKVTKMLLIVVCGFFLCWTPFLVAAVLYAFNAAPSHLNLLTVGIMFACMNSIINPIIYAVMNQNFRSAFGSMLQSFVGFFKLNRASKF